MKMTYHESYGDVSALQLQTYRRHNVSPADHNDLVENFGENPTRIIDYIARNAAGNGGIYRPFDLMLGRYL